MRFLPVFLFSSIILVLLELYVFKGVRLMLQPMSNELLKRSIKWLFWMATIFYVLYAAYVLINAKHFEDTHNSRPFFTLFGWFITLFVPSIIIAVFHLLDDISYLIQWVWSRMNYTPSAEKSGIPMSRAVFLTRVGTVLAAIPFTGIIYGILKGKYDYRIVTQKLRFKTLDPALHGLRLVQISDAHLGSFSNNPKPILKAIDMINSLEADVVVFTGDLVNNYAEEAEFWIPYFQKIKARYGKFSIYGNHDYGDYVRFPSEQAKKNNLSRLAAIHSEMGFTLLRNEHVEIPIAQARLKLAGVENWGLPPFPQHGDLNKAKEGLVENEFNILLSHDPSHWDAQVRQDKVFDLTLSGHTHGMQFGIEIAGIKWSPVKYKYPRWGGLYTEDEQHLYVNRGFGFLGFPGRVGMPPEITCFELYREDLRA